MCLNILHLWLYIYIYINMYVLYCILCFQMHLFYFVLPLAIFAKICKCWKYRWEIYDSHFLWNLRRLYFFLPASSYYKLVTLHRDTRNSSFFKNMMENCYKRRTPMNIFARKLKTMIIYVVTLIIFSLTLQVSVFNYWI